MTIVTIADIRAREQELANRVGRGAILAHVSSIEHRPTYVAVHVNDASSFFDWMNVRLGNETLMVKCVDVIGNTLMFDSIPNSITEGDPIFLGDSGR